MGFTGALLGPRETGRMAYRVSAGAGLAVFFVILIGVVLRLLTVSGASHRPRIRGETRVYGIKWQVRLLVVVGLAVYAVLLIKFGKDVEPWFLGFMALIILPSIVAATGSVIIDSNGIQIRTLWFSRSCRWNEVKEIRFNQNNRQLDIIGGPRKIPIDWRYATGSILEEVVQRTGLDPVVKT